MSLSDLTWFGSSGDPLRVYVQPGGYEGARVEVDDLEVLDDHPDATALQIGGIEQQTFEVLVSRFGDRFTGLALWNCPNLDDLAAATCVASRRAASEIPWAAAIFRSHPSSARHR